MNENTESTLFCIPTISKVEREERLKSGAVGLVLTLLTLLIP
jgi:hypothetical protein